MDFSSIVSTLGQVTGIAKPESAAISPTNSLEEQDTSLSKGTYPVIHNNWYTALPYGFKSYKRGSDKPITMFLPISPSNLTITTQFATNIIPTLYGTVEEHSPVRYFDIQIEGTTGMTPRFVGPVSDTSGRPNPGRTSFSVEKGFALGGFANKTLGYIENIKNKAASRLGENSAAGTGVSIENTGYAAFHNLYRFLLQYKRDASGVDGSSAPRKKHPLTFFNYKDNNEYDVVVRGFTLRRSVENPMLYYYSITLRGYNLRKAGGTGPDQSDLSKRLADLGLDGVQSSSRLGDVKKAASDIKAILGSLGAGLNTLGR